MQMVRGRSSKAVALLIAVPAPCHATDPNLQQHLQLAGEVVLSRQVSGR
jgi:hypothetical protein